VACFEVAATAEIMSKASTLANLVLVWNTVRIGAIVDDLAATEHEVQPGDLARISPMIDAHVIATGSYHFDRAVRTRGRFGSLTMK